MFHHGKRWHSFASRAHDSGAKMYLRSEGTVPVTRWDISGNCTNPGYRELRTTRALRGGKSKLGGGFGTVYERTHTLTIELATRCRKCAKCLHARAWMWRKRAEKEVRTSARTWFGTLTIRPSEHFKAINRARLRLSRIGIDFDTLPESQRFAEHNREFGHELTNFIKRVRKNSDAELRYVLVSESHKSGAPHYHMLVHEVREDAPVRHSCLTKAWRAGFSKFNLVNDPRAAAYVCKYLAKSSIARVRSSRGYGLRDCLVYRETRSETEGQTTRPTNQSNSDDWRLNDGKLPDDMEGCSGHIQNATSAAGFQRRSDTGGFVQAGTARSGRCIPAISDREEIRPPDGGGIGRITGGASATQVSVTSSDALDTNFGRSVTGKGRW